MIRPDEFVTIMQRAKLLGGSVYVLRSRDRGRKVPVFRNPIGTTVGLFRTADLEGPLREIGQSDVYRADRRRSAVRRKAKNRFAAALLRESEWSAGWHGRQGVLSLVVAGLSSAIWWFGNRGDI